MLNGLMKKSICAGFTGIILWCLFPKDVGAVDLWQQGDSFLKLTGYYKNLLSRSETFFPKDEPFTLDLNRLRLELQGKAEEKAALDLQYDHEAFLGSFLKTDLFNLQKKQEPDTYLDLENAYLDDSRIFARHRLYRGYLTIYSHYADLTIGRQRVAWGTARFWNPTDLLNPFNPIQLEREERTGVDAFLADVNLGSLSKLSLVYAPQDSWEESSLAVRMRTNTRGFDLSVMGGFFKKDRVAGFDFAGAIKDIGIRGEAAYTFSDLEDNFIRGVLSADYTFSSTLSLTTEYYYNGQGKTNEKDYEFHRFFSGEILSLARHYIGISIGYDITPILRWDNYLILNLNDGSLFLSPNLTYSVITDLDLEAGIQIFKGSDNSEYGTFHNLCYIQIQRFF